MGDFSTAFNTMTQLEGLVNLNRDSASQSVHPGAAERRRRGSPRHARRSRTWGREAQVTLLMSDLHGFTALAERLEATRVVALLNHYLSGMIEITQRSGGTIDDIIGDAILVVFGAPVAMPDAAQRAVVCALEMQKAMLGVNEHNFQKGWPEIGIGIALHTGEAVVGNIGSTKRSKYGVVGQPVNLTARIESFTVGGQVLVSPP